MTLTIDERDDATQRNACVALSRALRKVHGDAAEESEASFLAEVQTYGSDLVCRLLSQQEIRLLGSPDSDAMTQDERFSIRLMFSTLRAAARYLDAPGEVTSGTLRGIYNVLPSSL